MTSFLNNQQTQLNPISEKINTTNDKIFNKRLENMCLYNEIIPEFYQNLTNFDENKYMGEDFDKNIYKIICSLKAKYLNYISSHYSPNMAFTPEDNFMTFTISYKTSMTGRPG